MGQQSTTILGISCFYHDSAAAIVRDGQLIAAASEERFSRKKHTHEFPRGAIAYCLQEAGIAAKDLDYVVFYEKPLKKFHRILSTYITTFPWSFDAFVTALPIWLRQKLHVNSIIRRELGGYAGKLLFCEHHLSHAASAFLVSPFQEAAILTLDGVGEWGTTTFGVGRGNKIELLKQINFPHSLGLLYSTVTGYLGFQVNEGEGKVMGLAPYGQPTYMKQMDELIEVKEDGSFRLNMKYFQFTHSRHQMHNAAFDELFGAPMRIPDSELTDHYKNVAASLQKKLEDVEVTIAKALHKQTGMTNLCIAGGVGLNSVANWQIRQHTPFKNIFIQPGAGDDGAAIGAAFWVWNGLLDKPRTFEMKHAFWGPHFSDDEIQHYLDANGIRYRKLGEAQLIEEVAQLIAEDKVIGWFQDRMEVGPRALGARSILGNPANRDMKDILNRKVKHREPFRPFAPAVAAEDSHLYFDMDCPSPFMLLIGDVKPEWRERLPAITHVDGTGRVQTVTQEENGRYYDLCRKVGEKTGVACVIDTSFNVAGEPIVNTPAEAFHCYATTGIDRLVLGSFLLDAKTPEETAKATAIEEERMAFHRAKKASANERMLRQRQFPWWKKLLFGSMMAFIILGMWELGLRTRELVKHGNFTTVRLLAEKGAEPIYRQHPYLGAALVPGSEIVPDPSDRESRGKGEIHINAQGYRGAEFAPQKPAGAFRVVCLGGSTTFGVGATADDKVWPAVLQTLLRERFPGREIDVINAGVAGRTSVEDLIEYSLNAARWQPDLVLVYQGYNDLKANRYRWGERPFRADYAHWKPVVNAKFREDRSLLYAIGKHSMVFLKIRDFARDWAATGRSRQVAQSKKYDTVAEEGVAAFRGHVRDLAVMARADGASVLFGTFVSRIDPESDIAGQRDKAAANLAFFPYLSLAGIMDGLARHNQAVRDLGAELNVPVVDLGAAFPKDDALFTPNDDIHFTDAGNAALARLWFDAILANRFLE